MFPGGQEGVLQGPHKDICNVCEPVLILVVSEVYCKDPTRMHAVCVYSGGQWGVLQRPYRDTGHFCTTKEWFERNLICVAYFTLQAKALHKEGKGENHPSIQIDIAVASVALGQIDGRLSAHICANEPSDSQQSSTTHHIHSKVRLVKCLAQRHISSMHLWKPLGMVYSKIWATFIPIFKNYKHDGHFTWQLSVGLFPQTI